MFQFITKKPLWINLLAGLVLMVFFLFLLSRMLGPLTRHGKNRVVPNVVGLSFDEAKKVLRKGGFDIEIQDSIYSDTLAKGAVLKQVPEGDALVKISRTVYLTINRQVPPEVEMPNLIGFSYRNAEMQLKNMGLRIGDTTYKPDFAKNSVLEQWYDGASVAPGTKLRQGSVISLVLGNGIGEIEFSVPNLVGMKFSDAKALLESNGLSFLVVLLDAGVTDTMNAYIREQYPPRFSEEGKRIKIRPGQTIDVKLSLDRPVIDTLAHNLPQQ
jgi:beta-lactam-binding protein with PASTA domain